MTAPETKRRQNPWITKIAIGCSALLLLHVLFLSAQFYRHSSIPTSAVAQGEKEATHFADAWIASNQNGKGKVEEMSAAELFQIILSSARINSGRSVVASRKPTTIRTTDLLRGQLVFGWEIVSAANPADILGYLNVRCSNDVGVLKPVSVEFIAYGGYGVTDDID